MTQELYDKLVTNRLITKPSMTLEYINEHNLTLQDIITIPAILELLSNGDESMNEEEIMDDVVETVVEITEVDENDVPEDATVLDNVELVEEEIVVDDEE